MPFRDPASTPRDERSRQILSLFTAIVPFTLVACGDDSGGDDDDDAPIDARSGPDSTPAPDAGPDAAPGAFASNEISPSGQQPLPGIDVEVFDANDRSLGTVASDASATFMLAVDTGGTPLDVYLVGTSMAEGYDQTTYVYPPEPLSSDPTQVSVLMVSNLVWSVLPAISGATQSPTNGFVGILVADCFGNPVAGASIVVPGAAAIRYISGTTVSMTATTTDSSGLALAFDVPPGDVTVDASTAEHELQEHRIQVRPGSAEGGVLTTTIVAPGPITAMTPAP